VNVLFVCTANVARSPMAEAVFRELAADRGHRTRSAGLAPGATRRLTTRDVAWADVVAVMEDAHLAAIRRRWPRHAAKVTVLGVPDEYDPGETELRALLRERVARLLGDAP
jgi:predicted protein tyrosine phosphatase